MNQKIYDLQDKLDFNNRFNKNKQGFDDYKKEMKFIKETYKTYKDTHEMLFKIEGKLLNIDKTLEHYEIVLYNLYIELYELDATEKLTKKIIKNFKKK